MTATGNPTHGRHRYKADEEDEGQNDIPGFALLVGRDSANFPMRVSFYTLGPVTIGRPMET